MNLADAIPAALILLFGIVTGLTAMMVCLAVRLKRRSILILKPSKFIPGGSDTALTAHVLSHAGRLRRSRRMNVHRATLVHYRHRRSTRATFHLEKVRRG